MNEGTVYPKFARAGRAVSLACLCLIGAPFARADMLVSETTLVSGTSSSVASFTLTSASPITVQLSNIPWPQSLSSLSFMLSSANQVIGSWSTQTSTVQTYQLTPGTYFAHITGTAGGSVDLGLYSLSIGTQPIGAVPLPAGGALLATGLLVLLLLGWMPRNSAPPAEQAVLNQA